MQLPNRREATTIGGRFGWVVLRALLLGLVLTACFCTDAFAFEPTQLESSIPAPLGEISSPGPVPGRYIVTFSRTSTEAERSAVIAGAGATDLSVVPQLRIHVVDASEATIGELNSNPVVEHVEADQVRGVQATPSDPGYASQWSLPHIGWDQVFGTIEPAGSATVAVLDTGVDGAHPDLAGKVEPGTSLIEAGSDGRSDPNGHGTWMAGIVAAASDNATGIAGIGYAGVKIMPVTVLGADGTGSDSNIIAGGTYAADHGADVILMSFTNSPFSHGLQNAIDYAWSKGAAVVAAAGNDESATA